MLMRALDFVWNNCVKDQPNTGLEIAQALVGPFSAFAMKYV